MSLDPLSTLSILDDILAMSDHLDDDFACGPYRSVDDDMDDTDLTPFHDDPHA